MQPLEPTIITVEVNVNKPIKDVWTFWTNVDHITQWNNASEEWHTPTAKNDLKIGGEFSFRMEAKDGSFGFDFGGVYTDLVPEKVLKYTLDDKRKVAISFVDLSDEETLIIETFEAENQSSIEQQRTGWQSILNSFKTYAEKQ